jgi:hypothetical protein
MFLLLRPKRTAKHPQGTGDTSVHVHEVATRLSDPPNKHVFVWQVREVAKRLNH